MPSKHNEGPSTQRRTKSLSEYTPEEQKKIKKAAKILRQEALNKARRARRARKHDPMAVDSNIGY
jgi:hypothetical protein